MGHRGTRQRRTGWGFYVLAGTSDATSNPTCDGHRGSRGPTRSAAGGTSVRNRGTQRTPAYVVPALRTHRLLCNPRGLVRGHTACRPRLNTHSFRYLSTARPPAGKGRRPLASPTRGSLDPMGLGRWVTHWMSVGRGTLSKQRSKSRRSLYLPPHGYRRSCTRQLQLNVIRILSHLKHTRPQFIRIDRVHADTGSAPQSNPSPQTSGSRSPRAKTPSSTATALEVAAHPPDNRDSRSQSGDLHPADSPHHLHPAAPASARNSTDTTHPSPNDSQSIRGSCVNASSRSVSNILHRAQHRLQQMTGRNRILRTVRRSTYPAAGSDTPPSPARPPLRIERTFGNG